MIDLTDLENGQGPFGSRADGGYLIALHIRFTSPIVYVSTYPDEWQQHYTERGYVLRDPMTAWAFANTGWTRWSNPDIPDPYGIMAESRAFGLRFGATISHGEVRSRSIVGAARRDRELTDAEIGAMASELKRLHDLTNPEKQLTAAQTQALSFVASGMRYAEAAGRLGISESALKLRLAGARKRLLARTTAEAIQRAKDYRLI
ncbi:LuxR family transcriptional regulator [Palleronia sediminis]|uniref:LuxR family transcriptional regulator n=1 Tax=Palleronia sediminis TaxID=2547833 RepID=A0A4R6A689_9RHOB|nr:autoinducer binding domain-containing protein [Palleronia sediminis]TDL77668.1 LuxR family transcriptional regulator [Palleronia sediminis]